MPDPVKPSQLSPKLCPVPLSLLALLMLACGGITAVAADAPPEPAKMSEAHAAPDHEQGADAADSDSEGATLEGGAKDAEPDAANDGPLRNYWFSGSVNTHPKLDSASGQLEQQINRPFRLLAPGFDDITTFKDQADDFLIWSPLLGVGHVLSKRWDVFFQAGYSEGKVVSRSTDLSVLLLPLHTDVELKRSCFFAGPGVAFYPWGMAEMKERHGIAERLKDAKPFTSATLSYNYLTFDAEVKAGLGPLGNLIKRDEHEEWKIGSTGLNLGVDVPLTKNSSMSVNGQYTFFFEHGDDFSGPAIDFYWKRFF